MNTNWHDFIQRYLSGTITNAEAKSLEQQLMSDPALRDWYLDALNLDSALEAAAESAQTALSLPIPLSQRTLAPARSASRRWYTWRPLTAAAAGLLFGMFCTSVVFGFVGYPAALKRTPVAIVEPGFEDATMPFGKGFPDASAPWGGDEARVVAAENGVSAKGGKRMLRLEASPLRMPRFVYQVIDLTSVPSSRSVETREIEISASFAAADSGSSMRCMMRAFAVSELRDVLDSNWLEHRDEAIASASRGLDVAGGGERWQTLDLKIQVPRAARSLVLFFGVRTPDKTGPNTAHYIDDVRVSLIEPPLLP